MEEITLNVLRELKPLPVVILFCCPNRFMYHTDFTSSEMQKEVCMLIAVCASGF